MKRLALTTLLALAMVTFGAIDAQAHRVIDDDGSHTTYDNPIILNDFELSQVVYHTVTLSSNQLWFRFDAEEGQELYWEFGLPAIDSLSNYRPEMWVFGPGLPALDLKGASDITPPPGLGGFKIENYEELEFFFERFTSTNTWILNSDSREIEDDGTYYVMAHHPGGNTGKFWVALGAREEYGLEDILIYADTLNFVRNYHEDSTEPLSPLNILMLTLSYVFQGIFGNLLFLFLG